MHNIAYQQLPSQSLCFYDFPGELSKDFVLAM